MKKCNFCNQEKPLSDFTKLSKARSHISDGYQPRCKECTNIYRRTPEQRKAISLRQIQYLSNPENLVKKKKADRQYAQTEQGKKAHAKACAKYTKTQKGKATMSKISKKYRQTQKYKNAVNKHRLKFPEKRQANIIIMNALRAGKIIRPNHCSICNKICVPEGHHPDYSNPLDVVWMCKNCHTAIHWRPN